MAEGSQRIKRIAVAFGAILLFAAATLLALHGPLGKEAQAGAATGDVAAAIVGKVAGVIFIGLSSLPVLVGFWVGAIGLGILLQSRLLPTVRYRFVTQVTLGMAALLLLDWLLGWAGLLNPWTAWLLAAGGTGIIAWHVVGARNEPWHIEHWVEPPWTLLLCLPPAALLLVAATIPPGTLWSVEAFGYDVLSYHLQLPREWLAMGQLAGLRHNVYSYLPNLVEAGYLQTTAMHGQMGPSAIYTAQLLHASMALVAAVTIACIVSRLTRRAAGVLAAATFLTTPWVIITASLAYDEMAAMALAGGALLLVCDEAGQTRRGAAVIGVLFGATALAKLTVAAMLAPGVVLIVSLGWLGNRGEVSRPLATRFQHATIVIVAMLLTISPWLVRNAVWTGNPVFPFAAQTLGLGHWTPELAQRWDRGHTTDANLARRLTLLNQRGLTNTGFGALGGQPDSPTATTDNDITRLGRHGGVPLLWLTIVAGAAAALASTTLRRPAMAMISILAISLIVWLTLTHLQSRFLIPLLLPGCVLLGLGAGRFEQWLTFKRRWIFFVAALVVSLPLISNAYSVFFSQTILNLPPWQLVDSLATPGTAAAALDDTSIGFHPINQLAPNARVLMVADNGRLLYLQRPFLYASAFDENPLGAVIRNQGGDPLRVTATLKGLGLTHIWINWSELHRLATTYGYDPALTRDTITALANDARWQAAYHDPAGFATLFSLP